MPTGGRSGPPRVMTSLGASLVSPASTRPRSLLARGHQKLVEEPSHLEDRLHKSREDLLDAAISVWTRLLAKSRHPGSRSLGNNDLPDRHGLRATIIVPWRDPETTV
jgi:hypothetical protein